MDRMITAAANAPAGAHPLFDSVMIALTQFGVPLVVVMAALQWRSRNDRLHVRHVALTAGLSFVLGLGINQMILLFVHRVRPYDAGVTHLIIPPSADPSFPSDHATAVAAVVAAFSLPGCRAELRCLAWRPSSSSARASMWERTMSRTLRSTG